MEAMKLLGVKYLGLNVSNVEIIVPTDMRVIK